MTDNKEAQLFEFIIYSLEEEKITLSQNNIIVLLNRIFNLEKIHYLVTFFVSRPKAKLLKFIMENFSKLSKKQVILNELLNIKMKSQEIGSALKKLINS